MTTIATSIVGGDAVTGGEESFDVNPSDTSDVVLATAHADADVASQAVAAARAAFPA